MSQRPLGQRSSTPSSKASTNALDTPNSSLPDRVVHVMLPCPLPGTPGAPYFDGRNVTDFLDRYAYMCKNHNLSQEEMFLRLPEYCTRLYAAYIKTLPVWGDYENWGRLRHALRGEYADDDYDQQINSRRYLEALMSIKREMADDIRGYCRQFLPISENLIKEGLLDRYTQREWFLKGLPSEVVEKLILRESDTTLLNRTDKFFFEVIFSNTLAILKEIAAMKAIGRRKWEVVSDAAKTLQQVQDLSEPLGSRSIQVEGTYPVGGTAPTQSEDFEKLTQHIESIESQLSDIVDERQPVEPSEPIPEPVPKSARKDISSTVPSGPKRSSQRSPQNQEQEQDKGIPWNKCLYCHRDNHQRYYCRYFKEALSRGEIHLNSRNRLALGPEGFNNPDIPVAHKQSQKDAVADAVRKQKQARSARNRAEAETWPVANSEAKREREHKSGTETEVETEASSLRSGSKTSDEAAAAALENMETVEVEEFTIRSRPLPQPKASGSDTSGKKKKKNQIEGTIINTGEEGTSPTNF